MDPVIILVSIGMMAFGIYLIRIGIMMLINPKYRGHVAHLWFKTETPSDKKQAEEHVKTFRAPAYILAGCMFIYFAISLFLNP
jgi:hypothetical protein